MLTTEQRLLLACLPAITNCDQLSSLAKQNPDWTVLFNLGEDHGVLPLIYDALNHIPVSSLPRSDFEPFRGWFAKHALRAMQMTRELQRLTGLLTHAGISVVPFKGPVLAEQAYKDPMHRFFADLDLLVPEEQAWDALQVLSASDYLITLDLSRKRWQGLKNVVNHVAMPHLVHDWCVELHWEFFHPMYGRSLGLADRWSRSGQGRVGSLDSEETLLMLCAHGAKHHWAQLKWVVDIDRLVKTETLIQWQRLFVMAGETGRVRTLLIGLNLSARLCGTTFSADVQKRMMLEKGGQRLADEVINHLFLTQTGYRAFLRQYLFYLRSGENRFEQSRQVLRWLFFPRQADWQVFPVGDFCYSLYYVERPVRMVWKWLVKPLMTRIWSAVSGLRR